MISRKYDTNDNTLNYFNSNNNTKTLCFYVHVTNTTHSTKILKILILLMLLIM